MFKRILKNRGYEGVAYFDKDCSFIVFPNLGKALISLEGIVPGSIEKIMGVAFRAFAGLGLKFEGEEIARKIVMDIFNTSRFAAESRLHGARMNARMEARKIQFEGLADIQSALNSDFENEIEGIAFCSQAIIGYCGLRGNPDVSKTENVLENRGLSLGLRRFGSIASQAIADIEDAKEKPRSKIAFIVGALNKSVSEDEAGKGGEGGENNG